MEPLENPSLWRERLVFIAQKNHDCEKRIPKKSQQIKQLSNIMSQVGKPFYIQQCVPAETDISTHRQINRRLTVDQLKPNQSRPDLNNNSGPTYAFKHLHRPQ